VIVDRVEERDETAILRLELLQPLGLFVRGAHQRGRYLYR